MYMKLRNLLFGTMIACAFAACSNEDDPIPNVDPTPEAGTATASLTVSVKNSVRKVTKAGDSEGLQTANEAKINTLLVALYDNATGTLVATSSDIATEDATAENDEVKFEGLKEGMSLRAIAFANMEDISLTGTTTTSFTSPVITIPTTGFSDDNLPMSSGLSKAFTLAKGSNYYGYNKEGVTSLADDPLYLVRNVARVDLKGLSLDMTKAKKDVYVSGTATITPECVFIMHARTESNAADLGLGDAWWNKLSETIWGNVSTAYEQTSTDYMSGYKGEFEDDAMFKYMRGVVLSETDGVNAYKLSLPTTALVQKIESDKAQAATFTTVPKFYVYENPQISVAREMNGDDFVSGNLATELVIKGKYKLENAKKEGSSATYNYKEETAYWPIKIAQADQMSESVWSDGVIHRNVIYSIDATLAGKGFKDPTIPTEDFVELFVRTKVIDWGNATQSVVVE